MKTANQRRKGLSPSKVGLNDATIKTDAICWKLWPVRSSAEEKLVEKKFRPTFLLLHDRSDPRDGSTQREIG